MGRYSKSNAYSFNIKKIDIETYILSWIVDYYYSNSRLRFPRRFSRVTNRRGAIKFSKKHNVLWND